jgi:YggT family protein
MILIYYVLVIFEVLFIARAVLSWFPQVDWSNPALKLLYDVTEPILRPIRNALPKGMMIDLSTLAAILIIQVILIVIF